MEKSRIRREAAQMYKAAMRHDDPRMGHYYQGRLDTWVDVACAHGYFELMDRIHHLCMRVTDHRFNSEAENE